MKVALKRIGILLFLLLVWGIIFVSTMPLQFAAQKLDLSQALVINRLNGTIWKGSGSFVVKDQNFSVANLSWRWCPVWPERLLAACLDLSTSDFNFAGTLGYTLLRGEIFAIDSVGDFNLQLQTIGDTQLPGVVSGTGVVNIKQLELNAESLLPNYVEGKGELKNLIAAETALGDFQFNSQPSDDGTVTVLCKGGNETLSLDGSVFFNPAEKSYRLEAEVSSENSQLLSLLKPFGRSSGKNRVKLSKRGKLDT